MSMHAVECGHCIGHIKHVMQYEYINVSRVRDKKKGM